MLNKFYTGDAIETLRDIPNESVDMCITSPPYWQLRNYKIEGQLGLENTIEEFIENICAVFDEVNKKLNKEGSLYVNIADTYSGSGKGFGDKKSDPKFRFAGRDRSIRPRKTGIKDKSLCLIPERFAIAMTVRGWILRNVIIWKKPNAMPESVKDRYTKDFEYLYFFTKNKKYYFNRQTEPAHFDGRRHTKMNGSPKYAQDIVPNKKVQGMAKRGHERWNQDEEGNYIRNMRTVWEISNQPLTEAHFATFPEKLVETPIKASCPEGGVVLDPFMGSGTTAIVASRLGRKFIGVELNPEYVKIAEKRLLESM